ncbi:hypothetical protein N7533_013736 [Penicillium manginii]|uniref:uncharacterized protein n=1 Tax=Penicillium manginii TaxID=203109 RepID=UPI0025497C52|nr:uncharacterized protein N7533_013736 [Penicillium manginii]KAJ5733289.1 hypothetical protein N7533_013736 [Penicillium manginii]
MSRKRVRTTPALDQTRPPSPPHGQFANARGYIQNLSPRERVDMILSDIREHHRWSIKDLIYHMAQAPSSQQNAHSETRRARLVSQAIYGQPEVVKQLASVSNDIFTTGASDQISRLQSELRVLVNGNVLGEFEPDIDLGDVDIPGLTTKVQNKAPGLLALLLNIMTPPESSRDTSKVYQGSILMICSILASTLAPRKSNSFPMLIGLYLHAMGVKRRVICFLAGLGINSPTRLSWTNGKSLQT